MPRPLEVFPRAFFSEPQCVSQQNSDLVHTKGQRTSRSWDKPGPGTRRAGTGYPVPGASCDTQGGQSSVLSCRADAAISHIFQGRKLRQRIMVRAAILDQTKRPSTFIWYPLHFCVWELQGRNKPTHRIFNHTDNSNSNQQA